MPKRVTPIIPPGALSMEHLSKHCTACQLCIAECPNDVLRPSTDLMHLMTPEMSLSAEHAVPNVRAAPVFVQQVPSSRSAVPRSRVRRSAMPSGSPVTALWKPIIRSAATARAIVPHRPLR